MSKAGCETCKFNGKTNMVPWEGDLESSRLVVVGQNPGSEELKELRPFVGPCRWFFESLEKVVGIKREECFITNAVKCGGDNIPKDVLSNCYEQWKEEWEGIKTSGKKVVLLGEYGQTQLGLSKLKRGMAVSLGNMTALQLYHPAWALYSGNKTFYENDMNLIKNLLAVSDVVPDVFIEYPKSVIDVVSDIDYFLSDNCESFAFDIETSELDPFLESSKIRSLSLSDCKRTIVIDFDLFGGFETFRNSLIKLFSSSKFKIAHNAKFDMLWLVRFLGFIPKNVMFDTMIAKALVSKGIYPSLSLKQLVFEYEPEFFKYDDKVDFSDSNQNWQFVLVKNGYDSYLTYKIYRKLERLINDNGLNVLFYDILMPAVSALVNIENNGFKVDLALIEGKRRELTEQIKEIENKLKNKCAELGMDTSDFSLNSPFFLRRLFFDGLKLKSISSTKKGAPSLNVDVLTKYAESGQEEAMEIVKYRNISKLVSTYYDNYLEMVDSNGFIHPSFSMVQTATGRLSSFNPNIQNVPDEVRKVFISRFDNGKIVEIDFKQIEMRVMAIVSGDKNLMDVFVRGGDPHASVASELSGIPVEKILSDYPELRSKAKSVNFGLLYGMGVYGLASREKMSLDEAQQYIDEYFRRYPMVKKWQEDRKKECDLFRSGSSLLGRRWDFTLSPNEDVYNKVFNYPIQSLASDINLYVLGTLSQLIEDMEMKTKIVATVHDSIVFDCPIDEVDKLRVMTNVVISSLQRVFDWMKVPMEVSFKVGDSWGELEE